MGDDHPGHAPFDDWHVAAEAAIDGHDKSKEEMNTLRGEWKVCLRAVVREIRPVVSFFLRFVLWLGGLFLLLIMVDKHFSPIGGFDLSGINKAVALTSVWLLNLMGAGTKALENLIIAKGFIFSIDNSCTAVNATIIYLSAVLAYPGRMQEKIWGILFGVLALQVINLLRIIALYYVMLWFPGYFGGAHVYAGQVLVIGFACALWLWWLWWAECSHYPAES